MTNSEKTKLMILEIVYCYTTDFLVSVGTMNTTNFVLATMGLIWYTQTCNLFIISITLCHFIINSLDHCTLVSEMHFQGVDFGINYFNFNGRLPDYKQNE